MKQARSRGIAVPRLRRVLPITAIAVILAVTAITVVSRHSSAVKEAKSWTPTAARVTSTANHIRRNIGGQDVLIDGQTGEIKPLTSGEAQKLAEGLAPMLDQSTDDVRVVRHPDGSSSMNLEGRFQNVTVARVNKDGSLSQSCVDNPQAAGKFFGIDPRLIEEKMPRRRPRLN